MISIKEARKLTSFFASNEYSYDSLEKNEILYRIFNKSEEISVNDIPQELYHKLESFLDSKVLVKNNGHVSSVVKIIPFMDCWFFVDSPILASATDKMRELYISNVDGYYSYIGGDGLTLGNYATKYLSSNNNGILLDLCSGSGLLGISLSPYFNKVYGVEIDKRAYEWMSFNSKLNKVYNFSPLHGNLFEPVKENGPFDVIIGNPPYSFLPTKFVSDYNISRNEIAKDYGLEHTLRIVDNLDEYLGENGTVFLCTSMPFINGENYLINRLKKMYSSNKFVFSFTYLYKFMHEDFKKFYHNYGITKLYFSIIKISRGKNFKISEKFSSHYFLSIFSILKKYKYFRGLYRKIWK
tara:strand:- start:209 stop:1267 length:1059 start_codon:yes stop_codon:yes gene_type:complete